MKPTLFGYGLTTRAIAKKLGGGCTFFDDNCKEPFRDEEGNEILPSGFFDPDTSLLEVTTPSLPPRHPLIQKAKNLVSEYDYFLGEGSEEKKPFTIWISGTNGKTTTTQMLTHLLSHRGAVSGGNIGTPLAELSREAPIWVLESSSFALHHTSTASPNIYLLLPITPDHLDWHESLEAYKADKLRPLLTMKEGELALVPKGLHLPKTDAYVVEYEDNASLADYFDIVYKRVEYKAAFLQDALLSLAITKVLFDEVDYDRINSFVLDAHRQQKLIDSRGRLWINDSKATNLDATIQAVKAFSDRPIHLIVGGSDKGIDLTPLFDLIHPLALTLYTIGANEERLLDLADRYSVPVVASTTLSHAVEKIDSVLDRQSVAMLSPAAASFDQFDSYKHRGETFIKLVEALN